MFAYMRHYPNPLKLPITGILLYPRNSRIRFKTVDLTQPWKEIRAALVGLVG